METKAKLFDPDRAAALMRAAGLDLILASRRQTVAYITGVTSIVQWEYPDVAQILEMQEDGCVRADYFAGLPRDPAVAPFVVTHRAYEMQAGWITDVRAWCQRAKRDTAADHLAAALRERGLETGIIGVEMDYLPAGRLADLRERLPRARFEPADALLWKLRAIKTPEEIRRQRRAFEVATAIYRRVVQGICAGMTVNEVRALEMSLAIQAGCSPMIFGYVMPSYNPQCVRRPFADKASAGEWVLREGDLIVCDLGVVYQGYTTDFGRMISIGEPDAKARRAYQGIREMRAALEAGARPGRTIGELFEAGLNVGRRYGLRDDHPYFGHSIGLECHEAPSIVRGEPTVIAEGMTLVLEVCPAIDGIWFLLENTGVVTSGGWDSLTELTTDILVAPGR